MNEHWIVYRDVTGHPRKQFEHINAPKPGEMLIKDQTFPGIHGWPTMYIRRYHIHTGDAVVNLITYTETELSLEEATALATEAVSAAPGGKE